jgi:uncharacterized protein
VIIKPDRIFDRDFERRELVGFTARPAAGRASLGIISGRRRQGKTYLLQALAEVCAGLYLGATQATQAESLSLFAQALAGFYGSAAPPRLSSWDDAVRYLFATSAREAGPSLVDIDEFPYLSVQSPALPSILQREIDGGATAGGAVTVLLSGSALSVMGGLLGGTAPLRGRAGLELIVRPFPYWLAARYWGIIDPDLAILQNPVLGGTTALYHSVLAAVASGNGTRGGIASYVGRHASDLGHHLNVLEDCGLLRRDSDIFRPGRSQYRSCEPLITFYHAVMRPRWSQLEGGRAREVWQDVRSHFLAQVAGPHFEQICREFALRAPPALFGGLPASVGAGVVTGPGELYAGQPLSAKEPE